MKKILKRLIPSFLYNWLHWLRYYRYSKIILKRVQCVRRQNAHIVFLLMTPEHSNLGDHAIAYAELSLLKDFCVFEITGADLLILSNYPNLLKQCFLDDVLLFQGGGYLGTLWYEAEALLRKVFTLVGDKNHLIVFPQTIYYENSDWGKEEFEKSKEIYNQCSNLILTAREKSSFEIMKSVYNKVFLIPDVVLSLNECGKSYDFQRSGVSVCLRNDVEKTMSAEEHDKVITFCRKLFDDNVRYFDMCADHDIKPTDREAALKKQFARFRSSELVITDRLHGMIFAAITATPCIVLNSKSPKVKGVYDWVFKDCEYITFTSDFQEMEEFIRRTKGNTYHYDNSSIIHCYDELLRIIKEVNFGK